MSWSVMLPVVYNRPRYVLFFCQRFQHPVIYAVLHKKVNVSHRVVLPNTVNPGECLGVVAHVEVEAVKNCGAGSVKRYAEAGCLNLRHKDLGFRVLLEVVHYAAPLRLRNVAVDRAVLDALLSEQVLNGCDLGAEAGENHQLLPGL